MFYYLDGDLPRPEDVRALLLSESLVPSLFTPSDLLRSLDCLSLVDDLSLRGDLSLNEETEA